MRSAEPIGKWFIDDLRINEDAPLLILINKKQISYSDGTNTYFLGGEEGSKLIYQYRLNIHLPKVRIILP